MENKVNQSEILDNALAERRRDAFGLKPIEGSMLIHEDFINQIPFYSLEINLKNIRESDLDFLIARLKKIKEDLTNRAEITRSHIHSNKQ